MQRLHYLVCYDICNPRRLGRIGRVGRKMAMPLQYSVLYLYGTERDLDRLLELLELEMDDRVDDIRAYRIPDLGRIETIGQNWLPESIFA